MDTGGARDKFEERNIKCFDWFFDPSIVLHSTEKIGYRIASRMEIISEKSLFDCLSHKQAGQLSWKSQSGSWSWSRQAKRQTPI